MQSVTTDTYETLRPYLFAVAYRMTGSAGDAEDLVQDAWIRYLDARSPAVNSLQAYLTTIVSRLALDYLKSARVRREAYVGEWMPEPVLTSEVIPGPAESLEQREEVSIAFLTLLERLSPEQRIVYVLRNGFALPFDEIGQHLDRSAASCRQLFHRAQDALPSYPPHVTDELSTHRALIERFLTALEAGNVAGVAALLSENVLWVGDGGPNRLSTRRPVIGRDRVSRGIMGYAMKQQLLPLRRHEFVDLNGAPAVLHYLDNTLDRISIVDIAQGEIVAIRALLNPEKLRHLLEALHRR